MFFAKYFKLFEWIFKCTNKIYDGLFSLSNITTANNTFFAIIISLFYSLMKGVIENGKTPYEMMVKKFGIETLKKLGFYYISPQDIILKPNLLKR